ncbi:MAG: beta-propeller fold lactonase family protein [Chthoniobacterales bacterium]
MTDRTLNTVWGYSIALNGALKPVTGSPFATGRLPYWVAVDPSAEFVYVANQTDNTVSAYKIGSKGGLTAVPGSPFAAGNIPTGVTVTQKTRP